MFENVRSENDIDLFFDELEKIVPEFDPITFYQYDHHYSFARLQTVGSTAIKITLAYPGAETQIVRKTVTKGKSIVVRGYILLGDYMYNIEQDTKFTDLPEELRTELWRTLTVLQDVINNTSID